MWSVIEKLQQKRERKTSADFSFLIIGFPKTRRPVFLIYPFSMIRKGKEQKMRERITINYYLGQEYGRTTTRPSTSSAMTTGPTPSPPPPPRTTSATTRLTTCLAPKMIELKVISIYNIIIIIIIRYNLCYHYFHNLNYNHRYFSSVDCQWSDYGTWSECSKSCDKGTQVRTTSYISSLTPCIIPLHQLSDICINFFGHSY